MFSQEEKDLMDQLGKKTKEMEEITSKLLVLAKSKKPKKTLVNIVMDCSGSMQPLRFTVVNSFNEYIESLQKKEGEFEVSLTTFSSTVNPRVLSSVPLKEVKKMTEDDYKPDGMTALFDAIGESLKHVSSLTEGTHIDERPNIITVIITDGEENSSKEFTLSMIKERIEYMESRNKGTFVYLGANQDAWKSGLAMGVRAGNAFAFTATDIGVKATMDCLVNTSANYAQAMNSGSATASTFRSSNEDKPTVG